MDRSPFRIWPLKVWRLETVRKLAEGAVTHWSVGAPWPTRTQVEQDLLLSRLICEFANDSYLGYELIFRGGTCFHKLRISPARRYSEDLDYVRSSAGGIKQITDAVQRIGSNLGFTTATRVSAHPKVYLRTMSADGLPIRIKIEVNTRERSPAEPCILLPHAVESPWWVGSAVGADRGGSPGSVGAVPSGGAHGGNGGCQPT